MVDESTAELSSELIDWFTKNKVGPVDASVAMAHLLGVLVGNESKGLSDCIDGCMAVHAVTLSVAMKTSALKARQRRESKDEPTPTNVRFV